jgi:class 3 adenylate cyclase
VSEPDEPDEPEELDELDDAEDFAVAGLFDPAAANAASVLALLRYLVDEVGASIPELVQAQEEGGLMSFAAVRTLRPDGERGTLSDVAARAGIEPAFAAAIWRAAGFPDVRPFERRFGATDAVVFELVRDLATIVGRDESLQLVRTAGEAVARIAEAEIALLRSNVEAPLAAEGQFEDVARTYAAAASQLVPRVTSLIDTFHRHQLEMIAHRYSAVNAPTSIANVVELAVGFADIAGYTGLSHQLDASDLATMLARFEATTGDVIAASGANVAKRIGDAVMFVSNAPGIACALALELIEACARELLPKLRVGIAVGEVIVRQGDFYGPTVNLAARLVASAEPGTALTDASLQARLSRVRAGYGFAPAGRFQLAGFDEPLEVFQLIR